MTQYLELVCPAGSPAALRAAIEAGADTVYCGFRDRTNARNYPGLNFDVEEMAEGIAYAHKRGLQGARRDQHLSAAPAIRSPGRPRSITRRRPAPMP